MMLGIFRSSESCISGQDLLITICWNHMAGTITVEAWDASTSIAPSTNADQGRLMNITVADDMERTHHRSCRVQTCAI